MLLRNPDLTYVHYMDSLVKYTPDAARLFEYQNCLLFVCDGHLSRHQHFPQMLKFGPTLFPGYSTYPTLFTMQRYQMFFHSTERVVVPMHADDDFFPMAKVKGQLHLVTPQLIHSLDSFYQNGVRYRRRRVKFILPYREKVLGPWKTLNGKPLPRALQGWRAKEGAEKIHIIEAYMYVGRRSYWAGKLDGGYETLQCPIQFPNVEKNWLPRYYEFTRTFEEHQRQWKETLRRTG